ncbi:PP2C family protein-serine/threonine phosphatase [Thermodesulfobacteriota bacterium]
MKIHAAGSSHIGLKRNINEDRILISQSLGLFAVADGIGGHKAGDVASQMIVDILEDYWSKLRGGETPPFIKDFSKDTPDTAKHLVNSILLSNAIIYEAKKMPLLNKMGSTVTALVIDDNRMWVANVGDSPAYNFTDGELEKIYEDHSLETEQKALGIDDPDATESGVFKNVLTRAVGLEEGVVIYKTSLTPKSRDIILLCSDGLTKNTTIKNIGAILSDYSLSLTRKAEALVDEANQGGGDDNISVILVEVLKAENSTKLRKIFNS